MSGRSYQEDWGDYPARARQPLGPEAARQRRGHPQRRPGARGPVQAPGQPNGGSRSRFIAIVVLVVAAVIVTIGGIAAASGSGSATVSVSLLPFPQNTSTSTGQ
jgi:hypothetical protein